MTYKYKKDSFLRNKVSGAVVKIFADTNKIDENIWEIWMPKEGELFWGIRELDYKNMYKHRLELFVLYKIHDDGTFSLLSPLDKNVYSYWINSEDLDKFLKSCRPFIGELPNIDF